jgi:predicted NUDIX family phosphoesterase
MHTEKQGKNIVVVPRDSLFVNGGFQGYLPAEEHDYETAILNSHTLKPRGDVEENPAYKQPICYCAIINSTTSRLFVYQRAPAASDYAEARLRGKWSIGIGGHVDEADCRYDNPLLASMAREVSEELRWKGVFAPRLIGYINDESDLVGRVHFGLLYLAETAATYIAPRSREIAEAQMIQPAGWQKMLTDPSLAIEGWSSIATSALKDILESCPH